MLIFKKVFNTKLNFKNAAFIDENNTNYTYKDLYNNILNCSKLLKIKANSKIVTLISNSFELITIFLICSYKNCTLFPLSTSTKIQKIDDLNKIYKFDYFIIENLIIEKKIKKYKKKIFYKKNFLNLNNNNYCPKFSKKEIKNFLVLFTSGTTGNPKPLLFSEKNKFLRSYKQSITYNLGKKEKILLPYSLDHSVGIRLMFLSLINHSTIILINNFKPELWYSKCLNHEVTFSMLISSHLKKIVNEKIKVNKLKAMKNIVSVSTLLDKQTKKKLTGHSFKFHEMYGASEISTVASIKHTINNKFNGSVGKILDFVDLRILKKGKIYKKDGIEGEIICKTPLMFNGYYKDNKITKEAYFEGYFKTGDIGYLNKKHLYFLGRLKNIIKVSGLIVYPEDIEKILLKSKYISECLVKGIYDDDQGESIIAYIVGNKNKEFEILEHCLKYLENFQVPKRFIFKNKFPRTSLGKINRNLI